MPLCSRISRTLATVVLILLVNVSPVSATDNAMTVAMVIPGAIDDGGFMQAGYDGLITAQIELGISTRYISNVQPAKAELMGALQQLAADKPDMIIAHGGQTSEATAIVASQFPDIRFVVIQGDVVGSNLSSYEVLQEESAWLAGAAAGLLTQTNVVGHISGIEVTPGLKGRGAFYNGLMHTNPDAQFLTVFSGDQDDKDLAYNVATAQIDAGADIIFTMLNQARDGATDAIREKGINQIGNVRDWIPIDPEVFVGSAVADVSMAIFTAVQDLTASTWNPGQIVTMGLDKVSVVDLTLGDSASDEIRSQIEQLKGSIVAGDIDVVVEYSGSDFVVPK